MKKISFFIFLTVLCCMICICCAQVTLVEEIPFSQLTKEEQEAIIQAEYDKFDIENEQLRWDHVLDIFAPRSVKCVYVDDKLYTDNGIDYYYYETTTLGNKWVPVITIKRKVPVIQSDNEDSQNTCDHEPDGSGKLIRTSYQQFPESDNKYHYYHNVLKVYEYKCKKCGKTYNQYKNEGAEDHTFPRCQCGYAEPSTNPIIFTYLTIYYETTTEGTYRITVITDDSVDHVSATNNSGYTHDSKWEKSPQNDGTILFEEEYTTKTKTKERYWTITAYDSSNNKLGTAITNKISVLQGNEAQHSYDQKERVAKYAPCKNDANSHYLKYQNYYLHCNTCGDMQPGDFDFVYDESNSPEKTVHVYVNGVCSVCGAVNRMEKPAKSGSEKVEKGNITEEDEARLMDTFSKKMKKAGISDKITNECIDKIKKCEDEKMKEMWLAMFADPDLVDIRTHTGTDSSGCGQDADSGQIYITLNVDWLFGDVSATTVIHEIGHAVDRKTGSLETNKQFAYYTAKLVQGIRDDVRNMVQRQIRNEVEQYIAALLKMPDSSRDDSKISKLEDVKGPLIDFLTEVIIHYNATYDDNFQSITIEAYLESLEKEYFGDQGLPNYIDITKIAENVVYDFRNVTNDLVTEIPELENIEWKQVYELMISDVYGGVTNNQIMDGSGHYKKKAPKEKGKYTGYIVTLESDYWYFTDEDNVVYIYDHRITSEPWAEYTEARIQNFEGTLAVANAFLPSYHFEDVENEIYDIMMDYYDETGITEYSGN